MFIFEELTWKEITDYLKEVNQRLAVIPCKGEIIIVGGAVMTAVFGSRESTGDIDAAYEPEQIINKIVEDMAHVHGLREDWLNNDAAKFVRDKYNKKVFKKWSNLTVWHIDEEGMLALKLTAARPSPLYKDLKDAIFLSNELKIQSEQQLFDIVFEYFGRDGCTQRTLAFIKQVYKGYKSKTKIDINDAVDSILSGVSIKDVIKN